MDLGKTWESLMTRSQHVILTIFRCVYTYKYSACMFGFQLNDRKNTFESKVIIVFLMANVFLNPNIRLQRKTKYVAAQPICIVFHLLVTYFPSLLGSLWILRTLCLKTQAPLRKKQLLLWLLSWRSPSNTKQLWNLGYLGKILIFYILA